MGAQMGMVKLEQAPWLPCQSSRARNLHV
jgi:hypothetical protein